MTGPFSLLTWNINGVRARLDGVLTYLSEREPDIVCLQETKCEDKVFPRVPFMELGYTVHAHGGKGYAGVVTLTKAKPEEVVRGFREGEPDQACRIVNVRVGAVRVYNLYVPNGTALGTEQFAYKLAWLTRLRDELVKHASSGEEVVLCGDFNVAPDARDVVDPAALVGRTHFSPEEHAALRAVLEFGLRDCFRKFNDLPGQFTWFDYRAGALRKNEGMRIDHVYATAGLYDRCEVVIHDIEPRKGDSPSDHIPVIAKFK